MTDQDQTTEMNARSFLQETAGERAGLALELGGMGSFVWTLHDNMAVGDDCVGALFGVEDPQTIKSAEIFLSNVHPDDLPALRASADAAIENGSDYDAEFRIVDADGITARWIAGKGRVIGRETDRPQLIGVNWDITQRKKHEEDLALLAREMNHRVKNAFAVMQALVSLGSRSSDNVTGFAETLKEQVRALSEAHLMAVRFTNGRLPENDAPFLVGDAVRMALRAWEGDDRVEIIEGGQTLPVSMLSNFAMLVFELVTNATKYGPLGEKTGTLKVQISREENDVRLVWKENLDQEALQRASRLEHREGMASGFGSVLIQHCTAAMDAKVIRDLTETGLRFELRVPTRG